MFINRNNRNYKFNRNVHAKLIFLMQFPLVIFQQEVTKKFYIIYLILLRHPFLLADQVIIKNSSQIKILRKNLRKRNTMNISNG